MIAFVFPGQGSQKVGMGRALANAFPICRQTFAEADAALGEPLSRLIFEGPDDQLTLTENAQPAILAVSVAAARLLASRGLTPNFVAGHSLGEYSANVAAGTFAFAEALRLVRTRGRYMQEAVPAGGARWRGLGLGADLVARAPGGRPAGIVSAASLNGGGQVGDRRNRARGRRALARAKVRGGRDSAGGERAVSPPDAAGRIALRELRALHQPPRVPSSPMSTPVGATPARDRALVRQVSAPVAGSGRDAARSSVTRM